MHDAHDGIPQLIAGLVLLVFGCAVVRSALRRFRNAEQQHMAGQTDWLPLRGRWLGLFWGMAVGAALVGSGLHILTRPVPHY